MDFQINGVKIEPTDNIRYLWIKIHPFLLSKEQINEAIDEISRWIGMLSVQGMSQYFRRLRIFMARGNQSKGLVKKKIKKYKLHLSLHEIIISIKINRVLVWALFQKNLIKDAWRKC